MKVLVACEFSATVRDAFMYRGHDATSCDLLPSEGEWGQHYQGDVLDILEDGWDLMIAHPPCRYLAVSGARWFAERAAEQAEAIEFVRKLLAAPIPRICVENPVGVLSTHIRRPDQIIQPWQFGDDASKKTCLWLKNLEPLRHTGYVAPGPNGRYGNQTASGQNKLGPSPTRAADRARTYGGIAEAMADQWGGLCQARKRRTR